MTWRSNYKLARWISWWWWWWSPPKHVGIWTIYWL